MTWFVASLISVVEVISGKQDEFPVYEDFYLFEAKSEEELQNKIKTQAALIDAAGECRLDDLPARQRFVGVRKIRSVYNSDLLDIDQYQPGDFSELSHSFFILSSKDEVKDLADGRAVTVKYVDDAEE